MSALGKPTDITAEQAISVLAEGEYVHTFRGGGGFMVGCDWERPHIEAALRETDCIQLTGPGSRAMGHGIACNAGGILYIATDEPKLAALEAELLALPQAAP